ncbi:MAG: protein kinase [Chloroflexi bacterium]|nr:protein kinase [Chloroflexota bacterium]
MLFTNQQIIGGRFQVGDTIGRGGMGQVYHGLDLHSNQPVAIKHLLPEVIAADPEMLERFAREGEALRQLNHPNIVKMLAALQEGDGHYLVMEYMPGGDLGALLKSGKQPLTRILEIGLDLADALTRAHRLNIIHRDLKPANILLAADGTPRLTDFGVAHIGSKERVTGTGVAVGTVDYLAPEALRGQPVDARSDIWAFGVLLFEMLAGKRPFTGESITHTLMSIVSEPLPDLEQLCPEAPVGLVDLIYRMLDKDPAARIASVRQVGLELEELLQGRSTTSTRAPRVVVAEKRFATPPPTAHAHKNNLPAQTTPFIGREQELAEITRLLAQKEVRLVTILAPGGMGKTRLALEAARQYVEGRDHDGHTPDIFHNGVFFVELAPLSDPETIVSAIAEAVSYQFQQDARTPLQQVLDFLCEKELLLVLDNFEHLIAGAGIVNDILRTAPHIKVIATSRQRLNQSGETLMNLEGLDFPAWETPQDALNFSAVKLFMQSARRVRPDFELRADDLNYVARLCRLVQGLPLGIVLAAAWLEMLSLQEIAEEVARSLDFLETQMTDIPARQRSMRAVFDYSWNLMTAEEQTVFRQLAVFRGGFTREGAQAVANASLRTLLALLNKSLLRRDPQNGRYSIHELLRQYAEERLREAGEQAAASSAHSAYYLRYVQQREADLLSASQITAIRLIEDELENLRVSFVWAADHGQTHELDQALEAIGLYYTFVSRYAEVAHVLQKIEQRLVASGVSADHPLLWRMRVRQGYSLARFGDARAGRELAERCLAYFEQRDDSAREIAYIYVNLCYAAMLSGDYAASIQYGQRGQAAAESVHYLWGGLAAALNLGYALFLAGQLVEAKQIYQRLVVEAEQMGSPPAMAGFAYNNLGEIHHALSEGREALTLFEKAYAIFKQINNRYGMAFTLNNIGNVAHAVADYERAQRYNQQALDLYREIGDKRGTADALNRVGGVAYSLADFETSAQYHREALTIYRQLQDKRGTANSLVLLNLPTMALGAYDEALGYVRESLALRQEMGNPLEIADSLFFLGLNTVIKQRAFDEAIAYLDEAESGLKATAMLDPRLSTYRAVFYLYANRFQEAIELFNVQIPTLEQINLPSVLMEVYGGIGMGYLGLRDSEQAEDYLRKALQIALRIRALDWAFFAVMGLAVVRGMQGQAADAIGWLTFGMTYPRAQKFMREWTAEFIEELRPMLTAHDFTAAAARADTLDFETILRRVLGEDQ